MAANRAEALPASVLPARISRRAQPVWLLPLAAGIFLGAIAFELIPTASATLGWQTLLWAAAGFAVMTVAAGKGSSGGGRRLAWAGTVGIWAHSLLEGMAAGAGFLAGSGAALVVTAVLIMHLIPEAAALSVFGAQSGEGGRRIAVRVGLAFVMVAAGFLVTRSALPGLQVGQLAAAMGFAAGALVYLAGVTLKASDRRSRPAVLAMIVGAAWIGLLHL